ncbi:charged multivesicular body protein 1b [Trichuris trichiura]|uniref:Charged multivesicular body protein 1b n=1 Tax=Trichuris trichiura TaxID=36087 RepID=A0A077Z3U7_TRITR|nr:charged multivesicular body protein 1b [Trichuris trichiura]
MDNLFNLKFASKELMRNAKKCEKDEKAERAKLKLAIQRGNMDCAQIHAENAIRKRSEALNYMRMSSRIDAVAARVQTAHTTKKVTKSVAGVVKAMDSAMRSMNLEKVCRQVAIDLANKLQLQISQLMDKFESEFANLDVQSATMENAMSATTTLNTPQVEVDRLMQQVAEEAGLELNMRLPSGQTSTVGVSSQASAEQDELSQRLAKLRQL